MKSFAARISATAQVADFVHIRPLAILLICISRRAPPPVAVRPGCSRQKSHIGKNPRHFQTNLCICLKTSFDSLNMLTSTQSMRLGASALTASTGVVRYSNGLGCLVTPLYRRQRSTVSHLPSRGTFLIQCGSDRIPRPPSRHQEVRGPV